MWRRLVGSDQAGRPSPARRASEPPRAPSTSNSAEVALRRKSLVRHDYAEWNARLAVVYVRLINARLRARRDAELVCEVVDLGQDLRSGVVLYHLIEVLSQESLKRWGELQTRGAMSGAMKIHHIANLNVCFQALKGLGCKTVNVGSVDVYAGNMGSILGMLWSLFSFIALRDDQHRPRAAFADSSDLSRTDSSDLSPPDLSPLTESLRAWITGLVGSKAHVSSDLCASFRDGRLLAAMLVAVDPTALAYDESLSSAANTRFAFKRAEVSLGVPALLDPDELGALEDEKALIAYLCEFRHVLAHPNSDPRARREDSNGSCEEGESGGRSKFFRLFEETRAPRDSAKSPATRAPLVSARLAGLVDRDENGAHAEQDHKVKALARLVKPPLTRSQSYGAFSCFDGNGAVDELGSPTSVWTRQAERKVDVSLEIVKTSSCSSLERVGCGCGPLSVLPTPPASADRVAAVRSAIANRKRARLVVGVHRARGLLSKDSAVFCIVKYGAQELKTHTVQAQQSPVWNQDAMFELAWPLDPAAIRAQSLSVYIFSEGGYFSGADQLVGKVQIQLGGLVDKLLEWSESSYRSAQPLRPACLMGRTYLTAEACDLTEQDGLVHTQLSASRLAQFYLNPLHDSNYLFTEAKNLGALEISVFAAQGY